MSTVRTVEHVKVTVRAWFLKLMDDVAARAAKGGNDAAHDIEVIVRKARESIEAQLSEVSVKTAETKSAGAAKITQTIEWAKGMIVQQSLQVQAIGVQAVASSSKTGGREQMTALVEATEKQIEVAFDQCDASVTVQVVSDVDVEVVEQHKTSHIKAEIENVGDHKKIEHVKESTDIKEVEHKESKKKECAKDAKAEKKDSHTCEAAVVVGAVAAMSAVEYIQITIRSWYQKLVEDIASCSARGGDQKEIEAIVTEASKTITAKLDHVSKTASGASESSALEKVKTTVEWAKGVVAQGSEKVKVIGVQAASAGLTVQSIKEQMTSIVESTETEISTALKTCDASLHVKVEEHEKVNIVILKRLIADFVLTMLS